MVLAYHCINLPIANACFFCNDGWTFINAGTVSDLSTLILEPIALLCKPRLTKPTARPKNRLPQILTEESGFDRYGNGFFRIFTPRFIQQIIADYVIINPLIIKLNRGIL
jgi:hypothetical protein